jgi:hypothetical protein
MDAIIPGDLNDLAVERIPLQTDVELSPNRRFRAVIRAPGAPAVPGLMSSSKVAAQRVALSA